MKTTTLLMAGLVASISFSHLPPLSAEETLVGAAAGFDELTSVQRDALVIQADAAIVYHSTLGWQYTDDGGVSYLPLADAVSADLLSSDIADFVEEDSPTTSADFVLVYDSSEGDWVKTLIDDLGVGGGGGGDTLPVVDTTPLVEDPSDDTKTARIDVGGGTTGVEMVISLTDDADLDDIDANTTKLAGIESGATADQSDAEIATAYGNEVAQISGGEITAGTASTLRTYAPDDIVAMIDEHAEGGGALDIDGLTSLSQMSTADRLAVYDDSAAGNRKVSSGSVAVGAILSATSNTPDFDTAKFHFATGGNTSSVVTAKGLFDSVFDGSNGADELTAVATNDEIGVYDVTAEAYKVAQLGDVALSPDIADYTEDASPDGSDFVLTWTGSGAKKTAIEDLPSSGSSSTGYALIQRTQTNGTNGGTATADAWTGLSGWTETEDDDGLVSISGSSITLASGHVYRLYATHVFFGTTGTRLRINNTTDAMIRQGNNGYNYSGSASGNKDSEARARIDATGGAKVVQIQYYADSAGPSGYSLGYAANTGDLEVYGGLEVVVE